MASTAIKTEEEKKEYFDSPKELDAKVEQFAMMILSAEHMVAYTGAGISTSAGIPDYRSGASTCLSTGPGCWEKAANIEKAKKEGSLAKSFKVNKSILPSIQKAHPTKCHMALYELMEKGLLKHIISQNIDGLHRKSGIPAEQISELHGNTNLEFCDKCGADYMRDFRTRTAQVSK
jgi:NAD-dependent SIR2 family protein deacetylase